MTSRKTAPRVGCVLVAILAISVAACGGDDGAAPPAHPRLECVGDEKGFHPPAFTDISGPGAATADLALRAELERVVEVLGIGSVEVFSDTEYGVSVDGRVVMVRRATANPDGDWHVVDHYYCSTDETGERLVLAGSE
jgi:hypothetical protein